ncbi:MAG: DNA alkylation repair protein [Acidobacteria bacterium]|nr:DNA alkylation repair protein [Acidobacteriota bacterium]
MERYVDNWGWCDGIAHYLLSAAIANQPELARLLPPWTASRNRWKRRAAAVALVHEARRGRCTGLILEVARRMLPDTDDLVRKAVGWLLKEAYVARPREVMAFLRSEGKNVPRLVVRIIGEKMTVEDRLQVK